MAVAQSEPTRPGASHKMILLTAVMAILGVLSVIATIELAREAKWDFVVHQRDRLVAAEVALFGILVVEMLGRIFMRNFRERGALQAGMTIRAILRFVSYVVIAIATVSILAASPALAIGVGTVTGIILGFAAQTVIGNVLAGMILAIARPVGVGDELTVSAYGVSGRVVEIGVLYTVVDGGERWIMLPNTLMISTAIQRNKKPERG